MTIERFATETGIKRTTIQEYLAGKSKPSADALERIARAGVNVDWLLTGEVRPSILAALPLFENARPVRGVLAEDPELGLVVLSRALEKMNDWAQQSAEIDRKINFSRMLEVTWRLFLQFAQNAERQRETIIRVRQEGGSPETVAGFVTGFTGREVWPEVTE
jgi:transcriptional regulator with XRE-family HTH domain